MRLFQYTAHLSMGQRIAKNFFSLSISKLITSIGTFSIIVYLARTLLPSGFGKINFALIVISYFGLISNMGLSTLGVREIAKDHNKLKKYIENIVSLRVILGIISYLFLLLFVFLLPKPLELKALILLYGLSIFSSALFIDWVFKGIERMEMVAFARIIQVGLYLVFIFLWIKGPEDITKIPIFHFLSLSLVILFLGSILKKENFVPKIDIKFWKKILKEAFPIGFSVVMVQIYYNIDIVILGFLRENEEVGWYSAAYRIVLFVLGFAFFFGESIYPSLSQISRKNSHITKKFITATLKIVLLAGLPITTALFILGPNIISYIYGANYYPSIITFQVLVWSILTVFCSIPFAYSLLAFGKQKYYMYSVSLGALLNIILNISLIPRYGIMGASVATIISGILVLILVYLYVTKNIVKIHFEMYLFRIVPASVIMGAVVYICRFNLALALGCGIIVLFFLIFIFKIITKEEVIKYWKGAKDVKPL